MSKRRVHYVLSSHWDREWYQTFQDYRFRLVSLLDHVLDGLEDGRLKGPFTTDGQTIVLEDYLEVRPHRREQLHRFLREGKIVTGPWFDLPDEFLVSGESLIRNVRMGRQMARDMGAKPSDAGWFCDLFGHNSQMPQILSGFGIRSGFLWRGVNDLSATQKWRGADGTEILCHRFGATGYCTYAFKVRGAEAAAVEGVPGSTQRVIVETEEQIAAALEAHLHEEAARSGEWPILLFDGGDHQGWDEKVYRVLARRMEQKDGPFDIVHSSLDAYLAELEDAATKIPATLFGELREPGKFDMSIDQQWVIPGVMSSRVWIKQQNAYCQSLLCQWAEPFAAFADRATGRAYPADYLNVAWKTLMTNHPHDSICGCSIDQVHEDMKYRFNQVKQIGERLTSDALGAITAAVEGEVAPNELRVGVFNPLPQAQARSFELQIQIPAEWPDFNEFFGFEAKPAFRIYDAAGAEVPYQRVSQERNRRLFLDPVMMPQGYETRDVTVSLPLALPALGYTTLTVRSAPGEITRYPTTPGLATSERSMENENLSVTIESNGTLTVTDKSAGQTFQRLVTFEDCADIGDGWYHGPAVNDQVFVSTGAAADIALLHDGPNVCTFRIRTTMRVPQRFEFVSMTRSAELVDLMIDSTVSLRPGAKHLEVHVTVNNQAEDHRLRVLLPSGTSAETYFSDTPFDVVERAIPLRADNHTYRELEIETRPQNSWSAVCDKKRGLAVVGDGSSLECAVRDLPERPLALTLFRATRRTVLTAGEPGGELQGTLRFKFCIAPFGGGTPDAIALGTLGQSLAAGIRTAQLLTRDVELHRRNGAVKPSLPREQSFLELGDNALISAAQQVNGALEVRLYNPTPKAVKATLKLAAGPPASAQAVDLESNSLDGIATLSGGAVNVTLEPRKLATVRLG